MITASYGKQLEEQEIISNPGLSAHQYSHASANAKIEVIKFWSNDGGEAEVGMGGGWLRQVCLFTWYIQSEQLTKGSITSQTCIVCTSFELVLYLQASVRPWCWSQWWADDPETLSLTWVLLSRNIQKAFIFPH